MIRNNRRLLALFRANAQRGSFRAEDNTIYLYDQIVATDEEAAWWGGVSAETFVKTLKDMRGPVTLRINSPGGDVFGAKPMAQAMREYRDGVRVVVDGLAASAASVVAVASPNVTMARGSFMMIHRAWTIAVGNTTDMGKMAELLSQIDDSLAEAYADKAKTDVAGFIDAMAAETWFSAAGAVEAGLADAVAGEEAETTAAARWDTSAYEHSPIAKNTAPAEPDALAANRMAQRRRQVALLSRAA